MGWADRCQGVTPFFKPTQALLVELSPCQGALVLGLFPSCLALGAEQVPGTRGSGRVRRDQGGKSDMKE